ncbi:AlkA N-terminal domain-containing protein [Streptomyces caniscabiei]|uniref:DNA-3-methyladenine glycosylase 2 family protein n=1 Tax=Streptomyces caniscabiei TaxID=2746961 RepID=UPI0029B8D95A|nr:AlkA N-terminal domain-containing protein [Streptomyces caniscabiei]MDX2776642.1 AlkA N-terminal domain-containing protein [Streptomyces caniscabiei]
MMLNQDACYEAVKAHDRRFDGLFFTCVLSTGIYCRPVCRALLPKRQYCTFVATAAEAEKGGFRPCLRCRPERAPGTHVEDSAIRRIAAHIDATLLADESLAGVAARFGVSDRHMRRLFMETFGVEPLQYATTRRLLFAKQLLQDTSLPVVQVAYAAGFGSEARLLAQMKRAYGLTPSQLRRRRAGEVAAIVLRTDYRPPFDWPALLDFLSKRATPHEWVDGDTYHRRVDACEVVVKNVPAKSQLEIHMTTELARQSHTIVQKVRTLFDLDANPDVIAATLAHDATLRPFVERFPGTRVPGCWDEFETLLRTVVGQQVSVAGAATVMRRLTERIGVTPEAIATSSPAAIAQLGMPGRRAETIWNLGVMVRAGALVLDERDPQRFYDQLVAISGIGPWTAEYLKMRLLHYPDAFPAGDLGLQKALVPGQRLTEKQLLIESEQWRPWRSYATVLLWRSLHEKEVQ